MSGRRIEMHRIQALVRLHRAGCVAREILPENNRRHSLHRRGVCRRAMARELVMGRDTIRAYRKALGLAGLLDGDASALPDQRSPCQAIAKERLGGIL